MLADSRLLTQLVQKDQWTDDWRTKEKKLRLAGNAGHFRMFRVGSDGCSFPPDDMDSSGRHPKGPYCVGNKNRDSSSIFLLFLFLWKIVII